MRALIALFMSAAVGLLGQVPAQPRGTFEVSCTTVHASTSRADLVARFGAANIVDDQVYVGEGSYEPATILFGNSPERRAEFIWTTPARRVLRFMRISGDKSQWRTPQGLTVGLDLAQVERLNRRPFQLSGFGWDYGGTTTSWSGGVLAQAELPSCTVWARFATGDRLTEEESRLVGQVQRDEAFSSGHPGMQAAHARVSQIGLGWRQSTPADIALR